MPSAKLAAARAALLDALNATDDRRVRRCIDETLQHLHALEAELAAEQRAADPDPDTVEE